MNFFAGRAFFKFFIPSALGAFLFAFPIQNGGAFTVPIAICSSFLLHLLGNYSSLVVYALIATSTALTLACKARLIKPVGEFNAVFDIGGFWLLLRVVGFIFASLIYFDIGPAIITGGNTGGLVMESLLPTLVCVFFLAGFFLPLLLDFGLLDFFGSLMSRVMRPLFNLPGRSSVDCAASWLGDGTIGVLLTSKQYEDGHYSRREASVVATNFSAVSVTFSLVVISEVGLQRMFFPFYLTVMVAGIVAALVVPRLPPLSHIPEVYLSSKVTKEKRPICVSPLRYGLQMAIETAATAPNLKLFYRKGIKNILQMWFDILPVVLAMGTLALIFSLYTPIFKILGLPFIPIYMALQIPEAHAAAQTVMVGFADMFLPSVIASGIKSEMTRFVVAATSVSQLIYMSEIGSVIMSSNISLSFKSLFTIFLERTFVVLPIIAIISHFIF